MPLLILAAIAVFALISLTAEGPGEITGTWIPLTTDDAALPLDSIRLPPGYHIELYAYPPAGARSLTLGPDNTLYIGTRAGSVYAVRDRDGDGRADHAVVIAHDLNMPNGVAVRNAALYVLEVNRMLRYDDIGSHLPGIPDPITIYDDLPENPHPGWKYIGFGSDDLLYVPVGAPCNVCRPPGVIFSTILRMKADGSEREVFATGIRNTVGFDWHPLTGELWFTENGRDWLGDALPPDELNRAPNPGMDFGFSYCHGIALPDPEFGTPDACGATTPPVLELGAHVAPLGMAFYTGSLFPPDALTRVFIAEHGSWNSAVPVGPRITLVRLSGNEAESYEPFAEGWLDGFAAWGRPVDILEMPDGALFVSDDRANAIYRI